VAARRRPAADRPAELEQAKVVAPVRACWNRRRRRRRASGLYDTVSDLAAARLDDVLRAIAPARNPARRDVAT
jgi:hypothetical protein